MTINKSNVKVEGYSDEDIQTLDHIEHMRQRYGMYMGAKPAAHIVNETIDNCIDEVMNGFATWIKVHLDTVKNEVTVEDNGRGIPTGIHPKTKKPTIQMAIGDANTGGKFNGSKSFKTSAGLNGTGLKASNAICEYLYAESERDGHRVNIGFAKGKVSEPYKEIKAKGQNGTLIKLRPDKELLAIENRWQFEPDLIIHGCKMRAFLNKGVQILLTIDDTKYEFMYENGMEEFLVETVAKPLYNMKPITYSRDFGDNRYEISIMYDGDKSDEKFYSYTNSILNSKGTHETGFKMAFTTIMNNFIKDKGLLPKKHVNLSISGDDIRKGIVVVLNCRLDEPLYSSQVKDEISNPEVKTEIMKMTSEFFSEYISNNEDLFKKICNRIVQFAIATDNVKKEQEKIVKVSSSNSGLTFSNKFVDCELSDPEICELFICEGKSASGSIRRGRDGKTQAIYALKGKPLNTYGVANNTLINNAEFNELMKIIFGTNSVKDIDYNTVRFKKIIIISDSDDDGKHITALMSMAFKEHFFELIKRGLLYIACPPKYRITVNKKNLFFKNDNEYDSYKAKHVTKRFTINNSGLSMLKIIQNEDEFRLRFNMLKNRYSLPTEILSMILSNNELLIVAEYLDEQGLDVSEIGEDEFYVQGLLEDEWLDIELTQEMANDIRKLRKIFNCQVLDITDKYEKETYECDILDGLDLIDSEFKFTRYRFKGLGETNPEDLAVTSLDQETRDIIKIILDDEDDAEKYNKILFGNNADLRKDFIQENLKSFHSEE